MLRVLSAIGMSRYVAQQVIDGYVADLLMKERLKGQHFVRDGMVHVELIKDMGPFQLIMRGTLEPDHFIRISMICPALKEKRGYEFLECDVHEDTLDDLYMYGQEKSTLEGICFRLTEVYRFFREKMLFDREKHYVSCYGLSFE